VVNEKELQEFLHQNGFITVFMENLSFFEQRKLMAETSILISNHGAGLTNMLFMKENSIIIELKSDSDDINNCFFNLARALDHKYYYTINSANDKRVQRANINVDFEALSNVLNSIN
jgi:capsular polysaccharide biosynthesis protein